jgi:hypothetical protein
VITDRSLGVSWWKNCRSNSTRQGVAGHGRAWRGMARRGMAFLHSMARQRTTREFRVHDGVFPMRAGDRRARGNSRSDPDSGMNVLSYWRTLPAASFDDGARAQVAQCVRRISSSSPVWRDAIRGGAAAASGLVLRLLTPSRICAQVDIRMTVLLNSAFKNAGAALVLSYALRHAPLDPHQRASLASSWVAHNARLGTRRKIRGKRRADPSKPGESR